MSGRMDVKPCFNCGCDCLVATDEGGTEKYFPVGWEDERTAMRDALETCLTAFDTGRDMWAAVSAAETALETYRRHNVPPGS